MENEPRKASEVLLDLESKLDVALNLVRIQDLNIKILSNKLNNIIELLEKKVVVPQKASAEATNTVQTSPFQQSFALDSEKEIPISSEFGLPVENSPNGFRRTSRPETFSGDNMYLPKSSSDVKPKFPVQMPKAPPGRAQAGSPPPGRESEAVVPLAATQMQTTIPVPKQQSRTQNIVQNAIPVMQRIVDKNGKSVFLADVEITDLASMQVVFKTRTNGTGKWQASLGIGDYRVLIRKGASSTKEKIEVGQNIQVDGTQSPLDLQAMIIK